MKNVHEYRPWHELHSSTCQHGYIRSRAAKQDSSKWWCPASSERLDLKCTFTKLTSGSLALLPRLTGCRPQLYATAGREPIGMRCAMSVGGGMRRNLGLPNEDSAPSHCAKCKVPSALSTHRISASMCHRY